MMQAIMNESETCNKKLIKSEEIESNGVQYIGNRYNIENYGVADFVRQKGRSDAEFRKARAMIPFEYLDKKAKDFDWNIYNCDVEGQKKIANAFVLNFEKFQERGKGLYIFSKIKGSGKSFLASCLLNEIIESHAINAKFITILDFMELTKKGFQSHSADTDIDNIFNSRLLVLDDLGIQMKTEWIDTVLYRLINYRTTNKLVTIFTSNLGVDDLKVDERITDRIFKMTIPMLMPEISIRKKKANEENIEFIKSII